MRNEELIVDLLKEISAKLDDLKGAIEKKQMEDRYRDYRDPNTGLYKRK